MRERKAAKSNAEAHESQHQNGHLSSFLDPDASWDKDQLGDALHWIRQALALVCGLTWGAVPLVGGIWLILFVVLSTGIIYAYYALILKVDEEDFGGHGALLQEGLFASISLFLVYFAISFYRFEVQCLIFFSQIENPYFLFSSACMDSSIQFGTLLILHPDLDCFSSAKW